MFQDECKEIPPICINEYPAIKRHLGKFYQKLIDRQDKGITAYNLRSCAYHAKFDEDKVMWSQMGTVGRFALVKPGTYCNQKVFIITGQNLEYLCFILNSSLVSWLVKLQGVTTNFGQLQWDKYVVSSVPIADCSMTKRAVVSEKMSSLKVSDDSPQSQLTKVSDLHQFQDSFDEIVYDIYELSEAEKEFLRES
ncbi:MAG: hypothetical protein OXG88_06740 [Gammaproteobacteria bacterium]|nr:hypothetical protein [Gammaproteobacteria bacterium]